MKIIDEARSELEAHTRKAKVAAAKELLVAEDRAREEVESLHKRWMEAKERLESIEKQIRKMDGLPDA